MSSLDKPTSSAVQSFLAYQQSTASRLRYAITEINLQRCHDLTRPLQVLDAAGGNGFTTEFLLRLGHTVTLYDADSGMLEQARLRLATTDLLPRCNFVHGTLDSLADLLGEASFDLIVCHHVLEYVEDGLRLLHTFHHLAKSKSELSLITLNPVSEVIRAIIFGRDPEAAASKLSNLHYDAKWFGQARLYPAEDIITRGERAGWHLKHLLGIRVLADYMNESEAQRSEEKLLQLETMLADREPYFRMARYLQFSFARR